LKPLLDLGTAHNGGMMLALDALESMLPTLTILRTHFYDFFLERLENPSKYGKPTTPVATLYVLAHLVHVEVTVDRFMCDNQEFFISLFKMFGTTHLYSP